MFKSIQIGRGLAALAVAAFHLSITMGDARYGSDPVFAEWTSRGNLGVDFFFVLSGFIILFAHWDDIGKPAQLAAYVRKRLVRVYPIYLLYTLAFASLVLLGVGSGSPLPHTWQGWFSSLSLLRLSGESPPIAPAWTLFHEVAFYALFLVLILHKRAGLVVLAVWAAASLVCFEYPPSGRLNAFNVYVSLYNVNFLLGMLAFVVYKQASASVCRWTLWAGLTLLLAAAAAPDLDGSPRAQTLVFAMGCAAVLAGLASAEAQRPVSGLARLSLVGDASYTIYLLHLAFQGALLKVLLAVHADQFIGRPGIYICTLVGSTACCCIAYVTVERPLLQGLRSRARPQHQLMRVT